MAVFDLLGAPIQLAVRKCAERFPLFQEYITIMAKHAERSEDSMIGAMGDAGVLLAVRVEFRYLLVFIGEMDAAN
ncbi:hypothetical protein DM860_002374 [Cuscuta australis]|uniref:Uncharacterized protein n=1 Tax=Cuscuta australis TaxID=267555 RepID=A0A328CYW5_9ASTE|nr:hypothetical protein DM860_002374 [Cuscuta australis]